MAITAEADAQKDGSGAGASGWSGAGLSPQPRERHLLTGTFSGNGDGSALSSAQVFARGQYPVVGRFNLGTPDPHAADAMVRVRGLGISITTPDGQEWRSAMIDAPIFAVSTPQGFYDLLTSSKSKDPNAMKTFVAAHPEFVAFAGWAKNAPWTASYAEERYNSLNSFLFVDGSGVKHPIRWSLIPAAQPVAITPEELAKRGPDYLEQEITSVSLPALNAGALWSPSRTLMTQPRTPPGPGLRIAALSTLAP